MRVGGTYLFNRSVEKWEEREGATACDCLRLPLTVTEPQTDQFLQIVVASSKHVAGGGARSLTLSLCSVFAVFAQKRRDRCANSSLEGLLVAPACKSAPADHC